MSLQDARLRHAAQLVLASRRGSPARALPTSWLPGVQIKVKTLTGKEIEIDIESDDTISRIKERVEEKEGIPPPQQRLIFGGKQMADDKNVARVQNQAV